jgi:hypothetical protein
MEDIRRFEDERRKGEEAEEAIQGGAVGEADNSLEEETPPSPVLTGCVSPPSSPA